MKEILDRNRSRLTDDEKRSVWERIRARSERPLEPRGVPVRRWSFSFAVAVALVVTGVVIGLRERQHRQSASDPPAMETVERGRISSGPAGSRQLVLDPGAASDAPAYSSRMEGDRRFVSPGDDSLSTFSLSIGTRSYELARQFLDRGSLPPADGVRVEEFVNALPQGVPAFEGPDLRVFIDGAPAPFGDRTQIVRVVIKAPGDDGETIVARNPVAEVFFDPRTVSRYRLLGFDARNGSDHAAQATEAVLRAGDTIAALYEIRPVRGAPDGGLLRVQVRYRSAGVDRSERVAEGRLSASQLHPAYAMAPAHLRLAAAAADFAELLRGAPWTRDHAIADVVPIVSQLADELRSESAVVDFATMVRHAAAIQSQSGAGATHGGDIPANGRL